MCLYVVVYWILVIGESSPPCLPCRSVWLPPRALGPKGCQCARGGPPGEVNVVVDDDADVCAVVQYC